MGKSEQNQNRRFFRAIEKANQIAGLSDIGEMLSQMAVLIRDICQADLVIFYLMDDKSDCALSSKTIEGNESLIESFPKIQQKAKEIADAVLSKGEIQEIDISEELENITNILSMPIGRDENVGGVMQVMNYKKATHEILRILGDRTAHEVHQKSLIEAGNRRSNRLEALLNLLGQINSTLDRDKILRIIVDYSHKLLDAGAGSLFLEDEETGELVMQISSDYGKLSDDIVKVPAGKGIIGHVVETGETVIVNDVYEDARHYDKVDQNTGIITHSLLAVPLHSKKLDLGSKRGAFEARIIGGLEVINKSDGAFDDDDVKLLQTLANQAATTLEIAHLYSESNEVFLSGIKALTAAIDAKDKYTVGHSQRVSNFSVEIALELGLSTGEIYHLRIGTLLHDVGKIGIPDVILGKPGRLTTLEYERIKEHPAIGERILGEIRLLRREIKAVVEHHERLDGSGYPRGLSGDQISIFGKIAAVSDVFDAMTSERPYRKALAVEDVFAHLQRGAEEEFDRECVENLILTYSKGNIITQKEREGIL